LELSRRELAVLAASLKSQTSHGSADGGNQEKLGSAGYDVEALPQRVSANGKTKSRAVFRGVTTRGQGLSMHVSELAAGEAPHPPERQPHDEIIVIRRGTLEATLNGKVVRLGPGSVLFSAYKDLNGWRNVGTTPAEYYVISLEEHS
jgi:quercetin dioxygenase-like cupin family protein